MPATKKTKKKRVTKKAKKKFVEDWNRANVSPATRFKNRGGTKFTLALNGNKQHDIILEECELGGTHKIKGETKPRDLIDTYRAVVFFMWGIPLDTPVPEDFRENAERALKRMRAEDPDLFED